MKTQLILLSILGVWWLFLLAFVIRSCFRQVRAAQTSLTPEQLEQVQRLGDTMPQKRRCRRNYLILGPFIIAFVLFLLPLFLYALFLNRRDPHDKQQQA